MKKIEELEKKLRYEFKDKGLLKNAITHTSYTFETKGRNKDNERLEFLGDAVLELIVSEYLFCNYKNETEGSMTKTRASVVCEKSLFEIAKKLNLGDFLFLGKSEKNTGGNKRPSILSDAIEAIIGAIYLDSGFEEAKKFIIFNLEQTIKENIGKGNVNEDYKTALQEKLQQKGEVLIEYKIIGESGPDHDKEFTAQVLLNKKILAIRKGKNKKTGRTNGSPKRNLN